MARNKIEDLRNHLFEALERLKDPDPEKPLDLEREKMICAVSRQIIDSARVEVAMVRAINGSSPGTGFFNLPDEGRDVPRLVSPRNGGK